VTPTLDGQRQSNSRERHQLECGLPRSATPIGTGTTLTHGPVWAYRDGYYCDSPVRGSFRWMGWELILLSDAEGAEDQTQNVFVRGRTGHFIESAQAAVEIEQNHLVRNFILRGRSCGLERVQ
jgi:hypothetical protein